MKYVKLLSALFIYSTTVNAQEKIKILTLDPGHFHAALIQKSMYPQVDNTVHVYAEDGRDLKLHLERIDGYNKRKEEPTAWKENVYTGKDFFAKMIAEKKRECGRYSRQQSLENKLYFRIC